MELLKNIKINQKMIPLGKPTNVHVYGHSHSLTVPNNYCIDVNAKFKGYISPDGNQIVYQRVSHSKPKQSVFDKGNPFKSPEWNHRNLTKFMHENGLPTDF